MKMPALRCPEQCPSCGDRLIHLSRRGQHESSSVLGQFVHDSIHRNMCWLDIDGVGWRSPENILRIVEAKRPGRDVSFSQKTILPILARGLELLVADEQTPAVADGSGVFVLEIEPDLRAGQMKCDSGVVRQVMPGRATLVREWHGRSYECSESFELDGDQLAAFVGGLRLAVAA